MNKILLFLALVSFGYSQMPNYFYSTLGSTITSTDTTCTISSGDTSYFGSATNFYATIWDTYYSNPSHARSRGGLYETVLIESRSGLTLQIVRAQLGSTARNFNVSGRTYRITAEVLNNVFDSVGTYSADSNLVYRGELNAKTDSVASLRAYGNANRDSIHKLTDSVAVLRAYANANRDSIHTHTDSIRVLRTYIDDNRDSVDIRFNLSHAGSFNATSTFYSAVDGSITGNATETSSNFSISGIGGRVVGMYFGCQGNTMTVFSTITLMQNDSGSTSTSATDFVMTVPLNAKAASVTNQSFTLTPWKILRYKYVSGGGSGSITLFSLSLVVRIPKN